MRLYQQWKIVIPAEIRHLRFSFTKIRHVKSPTMRPPDSALTMYTHKKKVDHDVITERNGVSRFANMSTTLWMSV